jgi:chemotaxis protein CheZ
MGRTARFDESGDSEELQALFDSFAAPPPRPRLELVAEPGSTDEANVRPEQLANVERGSGGDGWAGLVPPELLGGLGPLLRHVFESLDALDYGYPRENSATPGSAVVRRPVRTLQMAQLAASRVINATEVAKPIQTSVGRHAAELSAQWERLFTSRMGVEEFEQLARNTRGFLDSLPEQSRMAEEQLTEIILAQYVQDSVFPVIKRLTDMAHHVETELARVVAAIAPPERLPDRISSQPADARGGRSASMGHGQIGDLLKGLGF